MQVEFRGLKETIANLNRIEQGVKNPIEPMRRATLMVAGATKRNAPVDTGVLRASITPNVEKRGNSTVGIIGSNVAYAPYMELGTRPHRPPIMALQTWARRHGTTAFVVARAIARRGLKPRKYLQRALNDNHDKIVKIFAEYVEKLLK